MIIDPTLPVRRTSRFLPRPTAFAAAFATLLGACGGGGVDPVARTGSPPFDDGKDTGGPTSIDVPPGAGPDATPAPGPVTAPVPPVEPDPFTNVASYRVTLENLWGADDFPQDFPDGAHLSLIGGALHDSSVSFWAPGEVASRGMEDIAEAGLIDVFLFEEVMPAIRGRAANALVEVREFTGPMVAGVPGRTVFDIDVDARWSLLTLATMLGPSPDWFVGVHDFPLDTDAGWTASATIDLPLRDGGSKSDILPVMGGPDIIPPLPIGLVAYDRTTGTYLPSEVPQNVARLVLERTR